MKAEGYVLGSPHGAGRGDRVRRLRVSGLRPVRDADGAGRARETREHREGPHALHRLSAADAPQHVGRIARGRVRERSGEVLGDARRDLREPGPLERRGDEPAARSVLADLAKGVGLDMDEVRRLHGGRDAPREGAVAPAGGGAPAGRRRRRRSSSAGR